MAEFKLGRIRFVWKDEWAAGTTYVRDDVVRKNGKVFICTVGHTADADFYVDSENVPARWNQLSDGQTWRGDWVPNEIYYINDIVKYGAQLYICTVGHTSAATYTIGLEADLDLGDSTLTKWDQFAESFDWKSDWTPSTRYKLNDIVKYGGNVYLCNIGHTSANTTTKGLEGLGNTSPGVQDDIGKWDIYTEGFDWKTNWAPATRYKINDVVKFGGTTYVCNLGHTSGADFTEGLEADQSKWDYFNQGIEYKEDWDNFNVDYKINDVVKYGGSLWICTDKHTSAEANTFESDEGLGRWARFVEGLEFESSWNNLTIYQPGDVITYGGYAYISKTNHSGIAPTTPATGAINWDLYTTGFKYQADWVYSNDYKVGDVVRVNGYTYVATVDVPSIDITVTAATGATNRLTTPVITSTQIGMSIRFSGTTFGNVFPNVTYYVKAVPSSTEFTISAVAGGPEVDIQTGSGSMTATIVPQPPNDDYWGRLNSGMRWLGQWRDDYDYVLGDAVRYGPNSYICIQAHHAEGDDGSTLSVGSVTSRPDQDTTGTYWDLLANGSEESVLTTQGDLVYYGGAGPTRLPIGEPGQVLVVNNSAEPTWEYWGQIDQLYYVALDGIDSPAPDYGITVDKPWRTVRYAAAQVEKGARNPLAATLLKRNRQFIQKETVEWINRQITLSAAPFAGGFTYNADKCERDVGFVLDAIIWDLTHGGNVRTRQAALEYVNNAPAVYSLGQKEETVAALQYAINTLVQLAILTNTPPAVNYQTLNSVTPVYGQYINADLVTESTVNSEINSLKSIVFDAITAGTSTGIPAEVKPNRTILVKTGVYYEVLPIIIPIDTAVVGDELRSTNIRPAGKLIEDADKAKSLEALGYIKTITDEVIAGSVVASPKQAVVTQFTDLPPGSVGNSTAVASITANVNEMVDIVTNGLSAVDAFVYPTPTGGTDNAFTAGYFNAARLILANKTFLQSEISAWINAQISGSIAPFVGFVYGTTEQTNCERDIGYIVDALVYDLTYGGNLETSVAARSYYSSGAYIGTAASKARALAVQVRLKDIIDNIATGNTAGWTKTTGLSQDVSGTAGTAPAATFAQARVQEIYNTINTGTEPTTIAPDITWVSSTKQASATALQAAKTEVQAHALSYIKANYPTLVFDQDLCSRDVGYMIDALSYDLLFASNYRSIKAAMAYYRGSASAAIVLANQKDATLGMLNFLKYKLKYIASSGSTQLALALWDDLIAGMTAGTLPPTAGTLTANQDVDAVNGAYILLANKDFLAAEAVAYINDAYPAYIGQYDETACARDVREFIDAIANDIIYTGNYNTVLATRYYNNAITTSVQENMFLVRNATGLRNMTIQGLTGTLGTANSYGTQRPSAGAYVSLDPGWGPDDERAWTTNKSCYVQNVTTFGTACVGLKIDGALHSGGNRSVVANDFTQVLSDGIGVWCTNLARTELVSVFSYYGHIGYLAENGGKIRATNGNSSYGTFGTVSEGVDPSETAITGTVNNRFEEAVVSKVVTNNSAVQRFEFLNAGSDYTSATFTVNGAGINATPIADEFRDDGVFEVRLLELDDSSGQYGGLDYVNSENVAQAGTTTAITLAATDAATSSAYNGVRIYIQSGTAAGQYGYINSYNAGSKLAQIYKESTGSAGWDHAVPGTTIVAPDASSLYIIEPRLTLSAPSFTDTVTGTLPVTVGINDTVYANTRSTHTGVAHTGGSGSAATFDVTRNGSVYTLVLNAAGTGYANGDTLTIVGTDVDGAATTNDITITIETVVALTGAISTFSHTGVGRGGNYVAVPVSGSAGLYSKDGATWLSTGTMQTSQAWSAVGTGTISNVVYTVAMPASGSTSAAYSTNGGPTWSTATLPQVGSYTSVAFGLNRFIVTRSDSATPINSTNGTTWANATNPIGGAAGYQAITFGNDRFVAVATGSTAGAAYSINGTSWVSMTLPSTTTWNSVAYGNGRFVAVNSAGTAAAVCVDGVNWSAVTSPPGGNKVSYGQGLFMVTKTTSSGTSVWTSEDGIVWAARTVTSGTYTRAVFGNSNRIGRWVLLPVGTTTTGRYIRTGATAKVRARVADTKIVEIRIVEPGSGYDAAPTLTITDPNNTYEAPTEVRYGKGCLANPSFSNRGVSYQTATATVVGDGYADFYQPGSYVDVKGLYTVPVAGSNVEFSSLPGIFYKLVTVTQLAGTGPYTARLQVSPAIAISQAMPHGDSFEVRIKYSQVRLTGHDFLDIGTGNFASTNYPNLPLIDPTPDAETVESGGGRVFYTSTDQDGNFRVGGLFTVEQATGTATLNADAFNIAGLQELQLGAVELGSGGATITEFSTDPFFTQDSDAVIPTQRAIKAYIASQIGSGSSTLNVNTLTAGSVFVSGDTITTTTGLQINVTTKLNFIGGVDGYPVAMNLFLQG
jgi:hypothetical protein